MANEIGIRGRTKFDGNNFQLWKFQITQVLVSLGVKGIAMGSEARPDSTTNAAQEWRTTDSIKLFSASVGQRGHQATKYQLSTRKTSQGGANTKCRSSRVIV
ncbi:hypothetical protein QAD02_013004 [Eretmocerus hayati]|uniref:Uncharacterized protein n=1 Tax=Eretmocerus hayati TaxID=131215 RepID=A0ACC2P454_9HYME|nr:hypothetical protein QAD02_013004 [Eretmocerus hayati]